MNLICPACFEEYEMPDSIIGQRVECPCGKKWNVLPKAENRALKKLFGYNLGAEEQTNGLRRISAGNSIYGITHCHIQIDKRGKIQQISAEKNFKKKQKALLFTKQILICLCRLFNLSPHDFKKESDLTHSFSTRYSYLSHLKDHFTSLTIQHFQCGDNLFLVQIILLDLGPDYLQDLSSIYELKDEEDDEEEDDDEGDSEFLTEPATLENVIEKYPQFADVHFGKDCPTENQFSYALHLGINVDKKTFKSISTAIDKAKASGKQRKPIEVDNEDEDVLYQYLVANSPASSDYMEELKELHADLPRPITNAEAEEIIEFLENHHINCPYCRKQLDSIMFSMESCPFCDGDFRNLKIPIFLD